MRLTLPWKRRTDDEILANKGLFRGALKHWRKDFHIHLNGSHQEAYQYEIPLERDKEAPIIEKAVIEALESRAVTPIEITRRHNLVRVWITARDYDRVKQQNEAFGEAIYNRDDLGKDRVGILTPYTYQLLQSVAGDLDEAGTAALAALSKTPPKDAEGNFSELSDEQRKQLAEDAQYILGVLSQRQLATRGPDLLLQGKIGTNEPDSKETLHRRKVISALRTDAGEMLGADAMRREFKRSLQGRPAASEEPTAASSCEVGVKIAKSHNHQRPERHRHVPSLHMEVKGGVKLPVLRPKGEACKRRLGHGVEKPPMPYEKKVRKPPADAPDTGAER